MATIGDFGSTAKRDLDQKKPGQLAGLNRHVTAIAKVIERDMLSGNPVLAGVEPVMAGLPLQLVTAEMARNDIPGRINIEGLKAAEVTQRCGPLRLSHHLRMMPPALPQDQAF
jgi:hypothetical protein